MLPVSLEKKEKKNTCEACVGSTSFPGFSLLLPRRRKRENPGNWVGARWPFVAKFVSEKTQFLCKWVLKLKAVSYFSADLYLTAQFIRGNYDWNNRDRRGLAFVAWRFWLGALSNMGERGQRNREEIGFLFFTRLRRSFARVFAASQLSSAPDKTAKLRRLDAGRCFSFCLLSPLLSCRFGEHHSITHLYGFLVVSIVANDISILTVYGNLTKMRDFPFWIYFVWNERSAPD